jgi:alpha-amylase/alpha-mannosidase (GH57 family)
MPHPLYIAFIWHQHQPLYKSVFEPDYRLPWVRLHGTKDYLDLVLLLEQFPRLRQTVNLVPSLLLQIDDYVSGRARDPYLNLTLTPGEDLGRSQHRFILEHFFEAHRLTLIDPHPRYRELYDQQHDRGIDWCLEHWTQQDYEDLLTWHNLAWIDPLFWDDPEIAGWLRRGRNFTLSDRQALWRKQQSILQRIIPQHRAMQERGQLEVTTSPYTHPILPLLADTDAGQRAVPDMVLPTDRFRWVQDVSRHLKRGREVYEQYFGRSPLGLWPSEQSVSPDILRAIVQHGFEWTCSDEGVLGWTLQRYFHRNAQGCVQEPKLLYRPYRLDLGDTTLKIVFRDHHLSDLIGFTYSGMDPHRAAQDLVEHLHAIARSLKIRQEGNSTALEDPWLVTIALDGENCWEFYAQDGKPFLETLYRLLSAEQRLELVTIADFLERFPPTETLPAHKLHSGSWVNANFTTWIGDPVKNRAWDLLSQARQTLSRHSEATPEACPTAWEALFAAEGSDWFWWFGEGHSSTQDDIFDALFREHLTAIYQSLGEPVPPILDTPLEMHEARPNAQPLSAIHPPLDGSGSMTGWESAGRLDIGNTWATMHRVSTLQRLWYGTNASHCYLRLDLLPGAKPGIDCPPELHLIWFYPDRPGHNSPIPLSQLPQRPPLNYLYRHHLNIHLLERSIRFQEAKSELLWHPRISHTQIAIDRCIEIAIPWSDLRVQSGWSLNLIVLLARSQQFQSVLPEDQMLEILVPSLEGRS